MAAPSFVEQLRSTLDAAVALHQPLLTVEHEHLDQDPAPGGGVVFGWGSRIVLQAEPDQPYIYFWYAGLDDDVMLWGDLSSDGWWPNESTVQAAECLQAAENVVHHLATSGRAQAVTGAARRLAAEARGERLLRRARWLRRALRLVGRPGGTGAPNSPH